MYSKLTKILLTTFFFCGALISSHAENISKYLSTDTYLEAIKRVEPKYPIDAARNRREGWVILSCTITEDGDVEDVKEVSSSGSKDIVKAAIKAVKKWKYPPSIENGKQIKQYVNTIKLMFFMGGAPTVGVSNKFRKYYDKAVTALNEKDYQAFNELIKKIKRNKKMHLSENNYLHLLLAGYAESEGDKHKQLHHLELVKNSLARLSTENEKLSVLYQTFNLQTELNQFSRAYNTYHELSELPKAEPYMGQFTDVIEQVDKVIGSDQVIIQKGKIYEGSWRTKLARNSFSISDINGELNNLDIKCANKKHSYTLEKDNTWNIPSTWKGCEVFVYGKSNSRFNLVEHPFSDKKNIN